MAKRLFAGLIIFLLALFAMSRAETFILHERIRANTAEDFLEFAQEVPDNGEVTIELSSPGGAVFAGFSIIDEILRLENRGVHVTTRVSGGCLSACAFIFLYGHERIIGYASILMFHPVHDGSGGHDDTSRMLSRQMTVHAADRLDFDLDWFTGITSEETWHDSSASYLSGFATHIQ